MYVACGVESWGMHICQSVKWELELWICHPLPCVSLCKMCVCVCVCVCVCAYKSDIQRKKSA